VGRVEQLPDDLTDEQNEQKPCAAGWMLQL